MKRLIAGAAACLVLATAFGSTAVSAKADPAPPAGTSETELLNLVKDKPDGLVVVVEGKDGKTVNFEQHGNSTSDNGSTGVVRITTEDQVKSLVNDPNVGKLLAGPVIQDPQVTAETATPVDDSVQDPQSQGSIPGGFNTDGSGVAVAVIDVGFETSNSILTTNSKIVGEYCTVDDMSCPGGFSTSNAAGSSDWGYCKNSALTGYPFNDGTNCYHGTYVAEVAAGYAPGQSYDGVAHAANLVLIRVGRNISGVATPCGACITDALTWLHNNRNNFGVPVVAVNMSFGGGGYSSPCDGSYNGGAYDSILNTLVSDGIMPVASAGNDSATNSMRGPACLSMVHSVTGENSGAIASQADVDSFTKSAAPYNQSARVDGHTGTVGGTSGAAAAVSGAAAAIVAPIPPISVGTYTAPQLSNALRFTGSLVLDGRGGCSCWGVNEVHIEHAYDRLREMTLGSASNVNLWHQFRIMDTRTGLGLDCCTAITKVGAGTHDINMEQYIGVSHTSVKAVILNITALNATTNSYISVGPGHVTSPGWSNINTYNGMPATATAVWTPMDSSGIVGVYNDAGSVDVIIDVLGIVPSSTDTDVVSPTRVFDSRSGTAIGAGVHRTVDLRSVGPIPSNATGVYGTMTVLDNITGSANTFITAQAATGASPSTSNMNLSTGEVRANFVVIPFATSGGNSGKIEFYNDQGNVHILFDVVGYMTSGDTDVQAITPARALDTRPGHLANNAQSSWSTSAGGCSNGGVILNDTLISGSNGGFVTTYPSSQGSSPPSSSVNADSGKVIANASAVPMGTSNYVVANGAAYYNYGPNNNNDLITDVIGCLSS